MAAHLRVYQAPTEPEDNLPEPTVRVRLGDLLPILNAAQRFNYRWLKDFLDDEVSVTEDLYEVLQVFQDRRPVA